MRSNILPKAKFKKEEIVAAMEIVGKLCATRGCHFSEAELGQMMTTEFQAMMMLVKSGNAFEHVNYCLAVRKR